MGQLVSSPVQLPITNLLLSIHYCHCLWRSLYLPLEHLHHTGANVVRHGGPIPLLNQLLPLRLTHPLHFSQDFSPALTHTSHHVLVTSQHALHRCCVIHSTVVTQLSAHLHPFFDTVQLQFITLRVHFLIAESKHHWSGCIFNFPLLIFVTDSKELSARRLSPC